MENQTGLTNSGPLRIVATRRTPFKLTREPLLLKAYRHAYYGLPVPARQPWRGLTVFLNRFYRRAWRPIYSFVSRVTGRRGGAAMLAVHLGGVERTVKINLHNTQFIALDTKVQEFKDGYEPEISALLDALLPDAGTFFDIGANWGYFSIYVASRVAFTGRIEAFEPVSKTFRDLTGLITDLDLGGRVRCHAIAVAEHNGKALISTGGLHSGMASLVNAQRGEEVQTARLDSLELPLPDAIKIDVEGYEANVLRGAGRIISEGRPMIIFENLLHPGRPDLTLAPFRALQDMGYIFYLTRYDVPAETLTLTPLTAAERFGYAAHANILACHASKRNALEYPAGRAASDVRAKSAFSPRSVSAEQ